MLPLAWARLLLWTGSLQVPAPPVTGLVFSTSVSEKEAISVKLLSLSCNLPVDNECVSAGLSVYLIFA